MCGYTVEEGCLLLCKDRNFKANHNRTVICPKKVVMFVTLQR